MIPAWYIERWSIEISSVLLFGIFLSFVSSSPSTSIYDFAKMFEKFIMKRSSSPEEFIFGASFITATILVQLPYDNIDVNPTPQIIFNHQPPSVFHAFVLCLNFAFTAAVVTMCFREQYVKIAKYSRYIAIMFMSSAIGILIWVLAPVGFSFVESRLISCTKPVVAFVH